MRSARLLALFLATGVIAFAFVALTVGRRPEQELMHSDGPTHQHAAIMRWVNHGLVASYGLLFFFDDDTIAYRSWGGALLLSGYAVEETAIAITGRYQWRLLALHNLFIAMITSALLGLLACRIAQRFQTAPRHAFAIGVATQMVAFTFPGSIALYWSMTQTGAALPAAIVFLLLEERAIDSRTRTISILQALSIFALATIEYVYATMFIAAYVATVLLTRPRSWKQLATTLLVPWLVAIAIFGVQLAAARSDPHVNFAGSKFVYRTGLDGDGTLYGNHLDIAFGRDVIRAAYPAPHDRLFRWPGLFAAGVLALIAIVAAYVRGNAPPIAFVAVVVPIAAYVLYAAVFSQLVAVHPYVFDILLATPLIFALFGVAPALVESLTESLTNRSGVVALITLLAAAWLSFYQLRLYALTHPLIH